MGTLAFLPSRLVDHFGLSVAQAGGVMVIYGASGLVYSHFARQSLALLGEKGLAWLGGGLIVFSMATLALANEPALAIGATGTQYGCHFVCLHSLLWPNPRRCWRGTQPRCRLDERNIFTRSLRSCRAVPCDSPWRAKAHQNSLKCNLVGVFILWPLEVWHEFFSCPGNVRDSMHAILFFNG